MKGRPKAPRPVRVLGPVPLRVVKRAARIVALILVFGLALAAGWVRLPYYAVGPGPAREVTPLIVVHGHPTYGSSGKLIMTTVSYYQVTPLQAIQAWIDPNLALVQRSALFEPGTTQQQEQQRSISQMDQSKIDATYVALSKLTGYPKEHGPGALIEQVVRGCPADGKLYEGDVVVAIDGHPVASKDAAARRLNAEPTGSPLSLQVTAAGRRQDVTLTRAPCDPTSADPKLGVVMIDAFPFSVSISSGDIGGPSAGLMWSLGLYDLLTPGDLTGGRTIAGTGTIGLDGAVGPIGGIRDKVVAAERVGATVFLAPKGNMDELQGVDTASMKVVPVSSFDDALRFLQGA